MGGGGDGGKGREGGDESEYEDNDCSEKQYLFIRAKPHIHPTSKHVQYNHTSI